MSKLPLLEISGTAEDCGRVYAQSRRLLIEGFFAQEQGSLKLLKPRVKNYWSLIKKYAPHSAAFIRGMARETSLTIYDLTLLAGIEEAAHLAMARGTHCSAVALSGHRARHGGALLIQNWDWYANMYPWAGLLKMKIRCTPGTLSYHYPGLPVCCGLNERGLALAWTGAGYYPPLKPQSGLPAYILAAEILRCRSVRQAIEFLEAVPQAGSFMFFIGDAGGAAVLIEGVNGRFEVIPAAPILYRMHLYQSPRAVRLSRQPPAPKLKKAYSVKVMRKFQFKFRQLPPLVSTEFLKQTMLTPPILVDQGHRGRTLDTLLLDCGRRRLSYRRAGAETWHSAGL